MPQSRAVHVLMLCTDGSASDLAEGIARADHRVTLMTADENGSEVSGLVVVPVGDYPPMIDKGDRLAWSLQLNAGMVERLTSRVTAGFEVVHAFGWDVAWAAAAAKSLLSVPVVSTIDDATRARSGDELSSEERIVAQAEWWLTYESRVTIVPSAEVRNGIEDAYELPPSKQVVIAPGSDAIAGTIAAYERARAADEALRGTTDERPSLRVVLGRSSIGSS
jgi:hypothetical protein